jgi:hypothetical protein
VSRRPWSHYAAPAAFLLAATVVVFVLRATLDNRGAERGPATAPVVPPPPPPSATTGTTGSTAVETRPGARYYTVVAGDTFTVISKKTGVSVQRIELLNPNVSSSALFIGQKIRVG